MTRRFWQASQDSRILEASTMLKLCICRDEDGELSGSFMLEGDFGSLCGAEAEVSPADGMQLVADLLREFQRRRPPGALSS